MITDGHPSAADAANNQALQQSWAFSRRAFATVLAERVCIFAEATLIVVVLLPRDVTGMRTGNHQPLVPWHFRARLTSVDLLSDVSAAVSKHACIAGVVQDLEHTAVREFRPHKVPFARPLFSAGVGIAGHVDETF